MRKYLMVPLLVLVMVLTTACGDPIGPEVRESTTYHATAANDAPLPYVMGYSAHEADRQFEFVSGELTFNVNGTYSEVLTFRDVSPRDTAFERVVGGGTYVRVGDVVEFRSNTGAVVLITEINHTIRRQVAQGLWVIYTRN